jgi:hypothetical protein
VGRERVGAGGNNDPIVVAHMNKENFKKRKKEHGAQL